VNTSTNCWLLHGKPRPKLKPNSEEALRTLVGHKWVILVSVLSIFFAPLAMAQVHQPGEFNGNRVAFGVKAGDPFYVETGIYYRTYLICS
jgi:hypothetical protein